MKLRASTLFALVLMTAALFMPNKSFAQSTAELYVNVNNTHVETEYPKYVLGGDSVSEVPFVAGYDLTADGGDVLARHLYLFTAGAGAEKFPFTNPEIIIYDEDLVTVLGNGFLADDGIVYFFDINVLIEDQETKTIFVKVTADLIGGSYEGVLTDDLTFALFAKGVEDVESGEPIYPIFDGGTYSLPSNPFMVVPAKFIDADFYLYAFGYLVDTTITNGSQQVVAILGLQGDDRDNLEQNGGTLNILLNKIRLNSSNTTNVTNYKIKRIGNGSTSTYPGFIDGSTITFDISSANAATNEVSSNQLAHYLITADVNFSSNSTFQLSYQNLNVGSPNPIDYKLSDETFKYDRLRIHTNSITAPTISVTD